MRYAFFVLWSSLSMMAFAGEPRLPLEKWTTTDGKTAEAAFQSIDEAAGTVTILVPRTIELTRLDDASRRLALAFSETATRRSPSVGIDPLAIGLGRPGFERWCSRSISKTVEHLAGRIKVLEELHDKSRSSSKLNSDGTNPNDI